jgi:hypothetical protein
MITWQKPEDSSVPPSNVPVWARADRNENSAGVRRVTLALPNGGYRSVTALAPQGSSYLTVIGNFDARKMPIGNYACLATAYYVDGEIETAMLTITIEADV